MNHRLIAAPALLAALLAGTCGLTACGAITGSNGTATATGTAGPAQEPAASSSPSGAPSSPAASSSTSPSTSSGGSGGSGGSTADGCPAGGPAVPKGTETAKSGDLDGDGKGDRIWLNDVGSKRVLGVTTASGARLQVPFTSAAPQAASAYGESVRGGSVVLLDTGRSVSLYAVSDCKLVPTTNLQGKQYTFDKGFTGYGTGVGCPIVSGDRRLAGYLAKSASGGTFDVTRTIVSLSDGGRKAANDTKTTLGTKLAAGDTIVRVAQSVSCGPSDRADEPQS